MEYIVQNATGADADLEERKFVELEVDTILEHWQDMDFEEGSEGTDIH